MTETQSRIPPDTHNRCRFIHSRLDTVPQFRLYKVFNHLMQKRGEESNMESSDREEWRMGQAGKTCVWNRKGC